VEKRLAEMVAARDSVQSELDDLLVVYGDLEDKLIKYKVCQTRHSRRSPLCKCWKSVILTNHAQARLRELGDHVSDAEEGEDDQDHASVTSGEEKEADS
jgi:intracellular protein transport protein USO1